MSSFAATLLNELRPSLDQLIKDAVVAALAENAGQPRYPERVNIVQASEITGYSKNSLYQMSSKGKIPGVHKVGAKLMFDTNVLQKWVENGGTPISN